MEIYEIKYLDCSKKSNRDLLVKNVKSIIKVNGKSVKLIAEKLSKKYEMPFFIYADEDKYMLSIHVSSTAYSTLYCSSMTECYCKYILMVHAYKSIGKDG